MNHFRQLCFLSLFFSQAAFSATVLVGSSSWQCTTSDATNTAWHAKSEYRKLALNLSFANCKKESTIPATCKTSRTGCQRFIHGINVSPMWRCTALDRMAVAWKSNLYPHRYDAALGAKAYCQQKSEVPGTCYVNLVTCVNINKIEF